MRIAAIYGAMPNYDGELLRALKIVTDTLTELDVDVETVNLAYTQIPYFDGMSASAAQEVMGRLEAADGVIFATTALLFGMSSVMRTFIEYFALGEYEELLRDKNCMLLVASSAADERYVLESMSRLVNSLGAFDSVRIGISAAAAKTLDREDTRAIIIRQAEDFYRIVRQSRRFFIMSGDRSPVDGLSQNQYETLKQIEKSQKLGISEVYDKLNLHSMTRQQEQDVSEITQILSRKYVGAEHKPSAIMQAPVKNPPQPRANTCKQMTQSMPHYFQPQMATGLTMDIQLNITGAEKFEGHIQIINMECSYIEGEAAAPDITILADTAVWADVLTGKCSAQKAFMIGKLKVRGNFVILTKLEQLFKPMT